MNTKRLQYFLLGVLVMIAGSVSADSIFGGGGSGGGAATSISGNGSTAITNGLDTAICYDDGSTIKCDATSPTWTKGTGKLGVAHQLSILDGGSVGTPAILLPNVGIYSAVNNEIEFGIGGAFAANFQHDNTNHLAIFDLESPSGNIDFEFHANDAGTSGATLDFVPSSDSISNDGASGGMYIIAQGGALHFADGGNALANESWKITSGNLTSVGASRNFTLSGVLTAGTGPTIVTNAAGKVLNAALASPPRATFGGQTGLGVLGATMLGGMYKPTIGVTLTRISGQVILAGTCAACGVTDTTFRVTDGSTNSDCLNASAILCTAAAGAKFNCTPSNTSRAADQELTVETVSVGGTCTTAPVVALTVEYGLQ